MWISYKKTYSTSGEAFVHGRADQTSHKKNKIVHSSGGGGGG